jgi:hypothetical protein
MTDCSYNKLKRTVFNLNRMDEKAIRRTIMREALAEAMRLLCRKGGPLADRTTKEIALPDLESLVASAEFLADAN